MKNTGKNAIGLHGGSAVKLAFFTGQYRSCSGKNIGTLHPDFPILAVYLCSELESSVSGNMLTLVGQKFCYVYCTETFIRNKVLLAVLFKLERLPIDISQLSPLPFAQM